MRRLFQRPWLLALLLAIAATGWVVSGQLGIGGAEPKMTKPPAAPGVDQQPRKVRVRTQTAKLRTVALIVNGQTKAVRSVDVRAEISGPVVELPVEKGTRLTAGTVIARIADQDRSANLAEAEALLAQRLTEYEASEKLSERGYRAETQRAAAQVAFEAAQAAVRRAEIRHGKLVVRAPFDDVLDDRMIEIGDYLDTGDKIARLVDLDPILLVAQISERDIGRIKPEGRGFARLVDGTLVEGWLRFVATEADPATRTFRVELEVENAEYRIADGLTAEIKLPVDTLPAHLVSPAVLTLNDEGLVGVMTVNDQQRALFRPVSIVEQDTEGVWLAGLPPEITLVTVGQEFIRHGQMVEPVDESEIATSRASGQ